MARDKNAEVNISLCNMFSCNLHDLIYIFLDNGVMTTPKCRFLSFVFTVLCFNMFSDVKLLFCASFTTFFQTLSGC